MRCEINGGHAVQQELLVLVAHEDYLALELVSTRDGQLCETSRRDHVLKDAIQIVFAPLIRVHFPRLCGR